MGIRDQRASSILLEKAADYIAREAGRTTLITPTRADISSDRKNATIYVSVFPTEHEDAALAFLKRHKDLFRTYLKKAARYPVLPYIFWELDYGERNRQHLDEISREIGEIAPEEAETEE